jgi:hypothetical protein
MADDHHSDHVRRFKAGLPECQETILMRQLTLATHKLTDAAEQPRFLVPADIDGIGVSIGRNSASPVRRIFN